MPDKSAARELAREFPTVNEVVDAIDAGKRFNVHDLVFAINRLAAAIERIPNVNAEVQQALQQLPVRPVERPQGKPPQGQFGKARKAFRFPGS